MIARALVLGLLGSLVSAGRGLAAVDATGRWRLDFGGLAPLIIDFEQNGGMLAGHDPTMSTGVTYAGVIDSSTGAFTLAGGPSMCGAPSFAGTVAPDSNTLTGTQRFFVLRFPNVCTPIDLPITGE